MMFAKHDKASFVRYLRETLIPDLREAGFYPTASDFDTCVKIMTGRARMSARAKQQFIAYLRESTAFDTRSAVVEDLETCLRFIEVSR